MDRERIEAFLDRFVRYASGATTMGLLAVADRSGLLAWLGEHMSGTSEEIAAGADLQERYVREILSGLAAAGALEYDGASRTFSLPAEHALFLSDQDSPYFMGGWFDMLPALFPQIDAVAEATRIGGGVRFEEFEFGMIRGIDRGNGPSQRVFLTKRWLPAVPGLVERLETGIRVADVGCGTGTAAILTAEAFSNSRVIGFDVSEESLEVARSRAGDVANVSFERRGAGEIPADPPFDLITTFDVIHDLADPLRGMTRIREALASDGVYLMMEPNASTELANNLNDRAALLYGVSTLHCMTQSLAVGGEGLGAAWGRELAEDYAKRAGFSTFQPLEEITNKFSAFYLLRP
ncbi:MAG TPA: class I SAM-dependent methyltransferase [Acidimicrobiia bacterium]|jgi:SAM-dependent methyltransferase|nr:class I SAM-dependent methyltransferase [Acidimicrobiia bacterium]